MKRATVISICKLTAIMMCILSPWALYYPVHDICGKWLNTRYSTSFTNAGFKRVAVGMSRANVIAVLGEPLKAVNIDDTVSSLARGPWNANYRMEDTVNVEHLLYSTRKGSTRFTNDYEYVSVTIGPDASVIGTNRHVTD